LPAWRTGHFSVRYWPGGSRAGSKPASRTFCSALDRNTIPRLLGMGTVTSRVASRPREFVRVAGRDAEDFLQRMLSNDVTAAPCEAMLLTPKARVIAPVVVVRREEDDFLLLTEPGLGEIVRTTLLRARFAAKVEIETEDHQSVIVFGDNGEGIPNADYGEPAAELLDTALEPTLSGAELERLRIEAGTPSWGKEIDQSILPAEAGLDETHVSFTKGCYPGQEPIARLRHRGKVNRRLRVLEVEAAEPGDELRYEGQAVGRVTSSVEGRALAFVRVEVPDNAGLEVGSDKKTARVVGT
jgi:folate-binding protein YgfZ